MTEHANRWSPETTSELGRTAVSIELKSEDAIGRLAEVWETSQDRVDPALDGKPMSWETFLRGVDFLSLLPPWVPTPEVSTHPDGEVAFYWTNGWRRTVSVAVRDDGRISFAVLDGVRRNYGSNFLAGSIPGDAVSAISAIALRI